MSRRRSVQLHATPSCRCREASSRSSFCLLPSRSKQSFLERPFAALQGVGGCVGPVPTTKRAEEVMQIKRAEEGTFVVRSKGNSPLAHPKGVRATLRPHAPSVARLARHGPQGFALPLPAWGRPARLRRASRRATSRRDGWPSTFNHWGDADCVAWMTGRDVHAQRSVPSPQRSDDVLLVAFACGISSDGSGIPDVVPLAPVPTKPGAALGPPTSETSPPTVEPSRRPTARCRSRSRPAP